MVFADKDSVVHCSYAQAVVFNCFSHDLVGVMLEVRKTWIIVSIILNVLRTVNVQYAMPMPMYQPPPPPPPMIMIAPPPPPVHIPVGVPYPVPVPVIVTRKTTTTTTTTTQSPNNDGDGQFGVVVPFPLPFGFPMPFAVPQAPPPRPCTDKKRPPQCPKCPPCVCFPSCTPAFYSFCSPCHQRCRCKGKGSAPAPEPPRPPPPVPLPMFPPPMAMPGYPMAPGAPPVFIIPFPPAPPYRRPPRKIPDDEGISSGSSESCDTSDSSSKQSDSDWRRRRRRFRMKKSSRSFRKNYRSVETDKDEGTIAVKGNLVKPMLSYISKQGVVKFQKRISKGDAANLMRDTDRSKSAEVVRRSANVVKDSRKVIFSPHNKLLSNLTVSFNVV